MKKAPVTLFLLLFSCCIIHGQTSLSGHFYQTAFLSELPQMAPCLKPEAGDSGSGNLWCGYPSEKGRKGINGITHSNSRSNPGDGWAGVRSVSWEDYLSKKIFPPVSESLSCDLVNVRLSSQDEVDAFGAMGCTDVLGDLVIVDTASTQKIHDLSPLNTLRSVGGFLVITTSELTSLEGLSNITSVGYLHLIGNASLESLEGLRGLAECTGPLTDPGGYQNNGIYFNPMLEDLSGLSSLHSTSTGLFLSGNNSLLSLKGLSGLRYIGGHLALQGDPLLQSLDSLNNLQEVNLDLYIGNYPSLQNLNGLTSLTSVGNGLIIEGNASLTNLQGLNSLSAVGRIFIRNNGSLQNLEGLTSLNAIGGELWIENNSSLTGIGSLQNLSTTGGIRFYNNPILSKLDSLPALTSVTGPFVLENNPSIQSIEGLPSLTSISRDLVIRGNENLEDLDGLSQLSSVGAWLIVDRNPSLEDLQGLNSLSFVSGRVWIVNNESLLNLDGLTSLSEIGGDLWLENNLSLIRIDGLSNLKDVGGIWIKYNASLTNLDGLSNIKSTTGDLRITNNPELSLCCGVFPLLCADPPDCTYDAVDGTIEINNNNFGNCIEIVIIYSGDCLPTGIGDVEGELIDLSVYPNPSSDVMIIDLGAFTHGEVLLKISDSEGQVLWQKVMDAVDRKDQVILNLDELSVNSKGVYFVSAIFRDIIYSRQVVVR